MARPRRPQPTATHSRKPPPAAASRIGVSRLLGVLILVASVGGGILWLMRAAPAGPVILISIDTLRADHLSAYGYAKGRTPNIDAPPGQHTNNFSNLILCDLMSRNINWRASG